MATLLDVRTVVAFDCRDEPSIRREDGRLLFPHSARVEMIGDGLDRVSIVGMLGAVDTDEPQKISGRVNYDADEMFQAPEWVQAMIDNAVAQVIRNAKPFVEDRAPDERVYAAGEVITIFTVGRQHAPARMAALEDAWPSLYEALNNLVDRRGVPDPVLERWKKETPKTRDWVRQNLPELGLVLDAVQADDAE